MEETPNIVPVKKSRAKKPKSLTLRAALNVAKPSAFKGYDVKALATKLVAKIDKKDLIAKVVEETQLSETDALSLITERNLTKEINDMLIDSVTQGAISSLAISKFHEAVEKGDVWAIKAAMAFNQALAPNPTKSINNLQISSHTNIFQQMNQEAKKLLGEIE